jgi:four helix bundle protein
MRGKCTMQNAQCKMHNADPEADTAPDPPVSPRLRPYDLSERFLEFADRICSVVEALPDSRLGRRIADQLLRSGTSPLGNYEEACAAESRRDFVHKLRICLKEIRESRAWLRLTARRTLVPATRLDELIDESEQLARVIGQSITTARNIEKKKLVQTAK